MTFFIQILLTPLLFTIVCRYLISERFLRHKDILLIGTLAVILGIIIGLKPSLEPITGVIILLVLVYYFANEGNSKVKVISIVLITMVLAILGDNLSSIVTSTLFGLESMTREVVRSSLYVYITLSAFLFLFMLLMAYGLKQLEYLWKKYREVVESKGFMISIVSVMILVFLSFYWLTFTYEDKSVGGVFALSIAMLSLLISVIVVVMMFMQYKLKDIRLSAKKTEMDQLTRYTSELEMLYDDMRKFKHDYVNMIASMTGYLETDNLIDLKIFFDQKIMPLGRKFEQDDIKLGQLSYLMQIELKGIISSKCLYAQELGVNVYLDIVEPVTINMDIIDLCRVIGIWLDNAIEATMLSDDPRLKVGVIKRDSKTFVVISNTVKEMPPLFKLREKGFSTKEKSSGIGLASARKVLNQYDYITNDMVYENGEFKQVLEVFEPSDLA
ncbi:MULTISPECIES: GHKL domain-containing protein [unclassified Fusibacter]|uniref:sensor histidine kinase n=1 Tax=unclassified Fusibacter TaxID=2624464 RepID=UPI001011A8E4|nr:MULTISPECIES: GHKL domain-containing protein [unclassified Fusibacter]MCK8058220.1 GHKL domain-containing protein [Fusibacter sp. A2]NPE20803.1 GHKL domain-containing protein [Fusibacter sp. A1]RXV63007.1 GHKL domain-containing protein [Fusibacter sp. A1]